MEDPNNQQPTRPAFRAQAWEFHVNGRGGSELAHIAPPWSWELLVVLGALVAAGLAFAILGQVEVNEKGPGVLRPVSGIRHLQAQTAGIVLEAPGRSGTLVAAGDPCVRVDSADCNASVLEAEENLRLFGAAYSDLERRQGEAHALRQATLRAKATQLELDLEGARARLARGRRRLAGIETLQDQGIVARVDLENAQERVEEAERHLREGVQAQLRLRQEQRDGDQAFHQEAWRHRSDRLRALNRSKAVEAQARQQVLLAPVAGYLDGTLVRPGDPVQRGQVVARIVPREAELRVLAFLQESHRAWIKEGDRVKLEVSQFPFHEFGALDGRILSMGLDFASTDEIRTALGEGTTLPGPAFLVEVQVLPATRGPLARVALRPGMRADVRFTLRRKRPISFVFGAAERWLQ